jgi:actin-related protein
MATNLIIDNGGCNCRLGWADYEEPTVVEMNATAHQRGNLTLFVADQITRIKVN